MNGEKDNTIQQASLNEESSVINEKETENMPKKKITRRKKVTFWATVKRPKRVKVTFYVRKKPRKQHKTKKR